MTAPAALGRLASRCRQSDSSGVARAIRDGSVGPLSRHGRCSMDAYQPGRAGSGVGEPVWHPSWADDDVARAAIEDLIPDVDPDRALEDDKGLVIGMVVQPGP
jgi:hypothetical protein